MNYLYQEQHKVLKLTVKLIPKVEHLFHQEEAQHKGNKLYPILEVFEKEDNEELGYSLGDLFREMFSFFFEIPF